MGQSGFTAETRPNSGFNRRQQVTRRTFEAAGGNYAIEASRCRMRSNAPRFQVCYCVDPSINWVGGHGSFRLQIGSFRLWGGSTLAKSPLTYYCIKVMMSLS